MAKKKIYEYVGREPVTKTIRFELKPEPITEKALCTTSVLLSEKRRSELCKEVKKIMDEYYREFIRGVLSTTELTGLDEYYVLYNDKSKNGERLKKLEKIEDSLRKQISSNFCSNPVFHKMHGEAMIRELLPEFIEEQNYLKWLKELKGFSTYFNDFYMKRKNMYSSEKKETAIAYRIINENLPKFVDNMEIFRKVREILSEDIKKLNIEIGNSISVNVESYFEIRGFNHVLSQEGIDVYNQIIGGISEEEKIKIKGINEYVNLYNQHKHKNEHLPLLKPLYKQILSERTTVSFIPESFESDQEVLDSVQKCFFDIENEKNLYKELEVIGKLFNSLDNYDKNGIWISSGKDLQRTSKRVYGDWMSVEKGWNKQYDEKNRKKIKDEKYYEKRKKEFKKIESFSLFEIAFFYNLGTGSDEESRYIAESMLISYIQTEVADGIDKIKAAYAKSKDLLTKKYVLSKKLSKNEMAVGIIKELMDSIKNLEKSINVLKGMGKESNKDDDFYGQFDNILRGFAKYDLLYDKVRNYLTKKPYSTEKIKLSFDNPQFLGGWDRSKEGDYRTIILRKGKLYYLGIMTKGNARIFKDYPYEEGEAAYEKMEYKLLPGPNKMLPKVFFAKSNVNIYTPDEEILKIYKSGSFKKGEKFSLDDCHKLIDFYKKSIKKNEEWKKFEFVFKNTREYADIAEFYNDVKNQGYKIRFKNISETYIKTLEREGKIYLFKIYNKDFSEKSSGTPNLHTIYFKMLFDERNLKNVVFKLNGEAEMFFRQASISENEIIDHKKGEEVANKNEDNPVKKHYCKFRMIKDRRYTCDKFMLHIPITINYKAPGNYGLNTQVRKSIKDCDTNYIIGIDRGERNLLYVVVINENGEIVEQRSLNKIKNILNDVTITTNYHRLLVEKEKKTKQNKSSWQTIESIKDLKEGYLSQAVKEICDLVVKYDAIIAIENLSDGFKHTRAKFERQVYQKFETMLKNKLYYLVDKKLNFEEKGGVLKGYQLINTPEGRYNTNGQDGFLFYVPAWLTSKIDPVTGFVNLLYFKYINVDKSRELFENMDDIRYNSKENYFEFDIDYSKFKTNNTSYVKKWTLCTYGERIITARDPENNYQFTSKLVDLTEEFKKLFDKYEIDYYSDLKQSILSQDSKSFYEELIRKFNNMLQMRNTKTSRFDKNNTDCFSYEDSETMNDNDFIISPVKGCNGIFFDSRKAIGNQPKDADANGAYNIARKALWIIKQIKQTPDDELGTMRITIKNAEWLEMAQRNDG